MARWIAQPFGTSQSESHSGQSVVRCFTGFTCSKGILLGCGVFLLWLVWFACLVFGFGLFSVSCFCFPLLLSLTGAQRTDSSLASKKQSVVRCDATIVSAVRFMCDTENMSAFKTVFHHWNENMDLMMRKICSFEENLGICSSIERVPSQSNPSDGLSREVTNTFQGKVCTPLDLSKVWQKCQSECSFPSLYFRE